jgi:FkbM family methyltransferase
MYSQYDEEKYITEYFGNYVGKFLDIGAHDGIFFNNTYQLLLNGWNGVAVEPCLHLFNILKTNLDNYPIEFENIAIGPQSGMVDFYDSGGDAISSMKLSHAKRWESNGCKFKKTQVRCEPISYIFNKYGYDFDFISIDAESMNKEIFDMLDVKLLPKLKLLCIEHDGIENYFIDECKKFGFKKIHRTAENIILGR